jgi:hypothetical protein
MQKSKRDKPAARFAIANLDGADSPLAAGQPRKGLPEAGFCCFFNLFAIILKINQNKLGYEIKLAYLCYQQERRRACVK